MISIFEKQLTLSSESIGKSIELQVSLKNLYFPDTGLLDSVCRDKNLKGTKAMHKTCSKSTKKTVKR